MHRRVRAAAVGQVYLASVVITFALAAHMYYQPFSTALMNRLETLGLVRGVWATPCCARCSPCVL